MNLISKVNTKLEKLVHNLLKDGTLVQLLQIYLVNLIPYKTEAVNYKFYPKNEE